MRVFIDLEAVKFAVRIANKSDYVQILKDKITVNNVDIRYKPYEMDYPDLSTIIDSDVPVKRTEMGFSIEMMRLALKDSVDCKYAKIEFLTSKESRGKSGIYRIDFGNNEHMAYVMPTN